MVNKALDELKIQAKILLKSINENQPNAILRLKRQSKSFQEELTNQPKLKHCQRVVACGSGFNDWQHAHQILSAREPSHANQINMGKLWHNDRCNVLLNHWFSRYQEAELLHQEKPNIYLFPCNK